MKKIDPVVLKETAFIAAFTIILSGIMQAVFILFNAWGYQVVLGNLLGAFAAVLNFFLMAYTVQKSVELSEEDAKTKVRFSQTARLFMLAVIAILGGVLKCFDLLAVLIPYLFPRIAVFFRPYFDKKS